MVVRITFCAWRSGGILASRKPSGFNRRTAPACRQAGLNLPQNCHTKHHTRHYAKPLLPAGILVVLLPSDSTQLLEIQC